jgi:hypothetical protein
MCCASVAEMLGRPGRYSHARTGRFDDCLSITTASRRRLDNSCRQQMHKARTTGVAAGKDGQDPEKYWPTNCFIAQSPEKILFFGERRARMGAVCDKGGSRTHAINRSFLQCEPPQSLGSRWESGQKIFLEGLSGQSPGTCSIHLPLPCFRSQSQRHGCVLEWSHPCFRMLVNLAGAVLGHPDQHTRGLRASGSRIARKLRRLKLIDMSHGLLALVVRRVTQRPSHAH